MEGEGFFYDLEWSLATFQSHGPTIGLDALNLCAQLTCDLFAIAKFL